MKLRVALLAQLVALAVVRATATDPAVLDACPGYTVDSVVTQGNALTANLVLAGTPCNVFGTDIAALKLEVTYENEPDPPQNHRPLKWRYEIPESVLPRPTADPTTDPTTANIRFNYTASPFALSTARQTDLPANANLYGLGEHTDTFRLPTHNFTRTMWSRDATECHRGTTSPATGTHGVFLANSNGMDIKVDDAQANTTTLEYNVIGGVLDFYFLAGSETDPLELVRQYADVVGTPAEVPYWSFGFHQCRFGYQNYIDVSEVITNYSAAGIPLETMWTDIDYMDRRRIFTVDPDYFPLDRMREIVDYLHDHDQKYVLMTDPAIAYLPDQDYGPFDRGTADDVWLMAANNSSPFLGAVWPGVTVFPDWFNDKTQAFWDNEFALFYDPETGIDIDGAWIDMNEPSSFCNYPCTDPFAQAQQQDLPPPRSTAPPPPDAPIFNQTSTTPSASRVDHASDNVQAPPYAIQNFAGAGALSDKTAYTDAMHANGLIEYDTHNLYGTMMSTATHNAMLARRPGLRTLVITRSTFAGAGTRVGKWLGDNFSEWSHYKQSIYGILGMAGIFHVPMVGADICGYAENTTETLCARWAMLGAFYPFMRNHNGDTSISQEFYRWPTTTVAAKNALDVRYRLLDYLYTAFHAASTDGTPDAATFAVDTQFLFGPSVLVSPVIEENATSVDAYFRPRNIPVHIVGGAVLPLRAPGAMTTTELRATDFELVVAPGVDGTAAGSLYADDGVSVEQAATTTVDFKFSSGTLEVSGDFGYALG
ncbi:alpha-glucosidase [Epithele typhae]|uniref:alpha-glucosidase n=1 Tax=Epithele typhae TaxID=378194 RepID=UPI002007FA37|nr:alpha-glucosidase [Epithele typhae]KAH9923696.1 alpha-glucosidase [Epithele typhae]